MDWGTSPHGLSDATSTSSSFFARDIFLVRGFFDLPYICPYTGVIDIDSIYCTPAGARISTYTILPVGVKVSLSITQS